MEVHAGEAGSGQSCVFCLFCAGPLFCLKALFFLSFLIGCRADVQVCEVRWLIDFPCSGRYGPDDWYCFCDGL